MYGTNDPLKDLDLSGVEAKEGVVLLPPGRHAVYTHGAKVDTTATERQIVVMVQSADGAGELTARFKCWAKNDDAKRISLERLKAMCEFGGHPNPNKPFLAGTDPLNGLAVGVLVEMGKPYTKDGKTKQYPEIKGFYKLDAEDHMRVKGIAVRALSQKKGGQASISQMASAQEIDDEIPF